MLRRVEYGEFNEPAGNLIVARLWERLGDVRRAYAATQRVRITATPQPFAASYQRERARLAAASGDVNGAIRAYRHYVAERARPEPALVADLEAAKRELARLEKQAGGR
jgi:hypothetical protein